jgi:hypothetical protein
MGSLGKPATTSTSLWNSEFTSSLCWADVEPEQPVSTTFTYKSSYYSKPTSSNTASTSLKSNTATSTTSYASRYKYQSSYYGGNKPHSDSSTSTFTVVEKRRRKQPTEQELAEIEQRRLERQYRRQENEANRLRNRKSCHFVIEDNSECCIFPNIDC